MTLRGAALRALLCVLVSGCAATRPVQRADEVESAATSAETHPELQLAEPEVAQVPVTPVAQRPTRHTVEAGQTVFRISRMYGCEVEAVLGANGMKDPRTLKVGQVLVVPECGARADGPLTPSLSQGERGGGSQGVGEVISSGKSGAGSRAVSAEVASARGTLEWPLRGVLYARFGKKGREPHDGIDLAAPEGTSVRTAAPG
ncbi:MAG: LysM peptidoglycan-binding domain-containing protein, partial [Myxococcaceae bacterium]|nr:LysM peptidoglycan-binding domain-containing protein [Myxococcaceae bacterium]